MGVKEASRNTQQPAAGVAAAEAYRAQSMRSQPRGRTSRRLTPPLLLLLLVAHLAVLSILTDCIHAGPAMPDFLGKKYRLDSSENFDEFMKALGVGLITRKMGGAVSPTVEVTENNGEYVMKTQSTFKSQELKFKPGEEFEEETPDGRKVKSVITFDGNKMIHIQKGEKETVIEREFGPTEMKAIMKVDNIICTRIYKLEN